MGTLGAYLREAREARGLDLREAAQQTRISVNYLSAIENEDFVKLPGEVFVKGFLKNYAKFLGLSESEVMKRYGETKAPSPQDQTAANKAERSRNVDQGTGKYEFSVPKRTLEPYLWGALALFAVIAVLFMVVPRQHAPKERGPVVSSTTHTGEVVTAPSRTALPDKQYLEIEAVEDAWALVRTDASPQKKAVLRKGEVVTWSAEERFLLSFGGIGSVVLRLNGKELVVPGAKGAVVRDLMITAAGVVAPKIEAAPRPPRKPKPETATTPTGTVSTTVATQPSAPAPGPAPAPAEPRPSTPTSTEPAKPAPPPSALGTTQE
jgi:cytoskeletal protein RodZ